MEEYEQSNLYDRKRSRNPRFNDLMTLSTSFVPNELASNRHLLSLNEWDDHLIENASTEPLVMLAANDNWVEFTLRYVVDYKRRRVTKDRLFTLVLERFDETRGQVSMASTTFHLVELPTVKVSVEK